MTASRIATTPAGFARCVGLALVFAAVLALPTPTATAAELQLDAAAAKAAAHAKITCKHDTGCVESGVSNCHRQKPRLAFCRIFVRRDTPVQGKYRCTRLVRLGLVPHTRKARVTGLGHWHC